MSIFYFFRRNKQQPTNDAETPSPEQLAFCETAVALFTPVLKEKGFDLEKTNVKKYFTGITYRKGTQYIEITGTTYPTDYPYAYNIILGDGDSDDFFEHDWNSIALWRIKASTDPTAKEYDFPYDEDILRSLEHARNELLTFGSTFLSGNLSDFIEARKSQNKDREPYRISYADQNGNRQVTYDEKSIEMKNKYG